MPTKKLPLIIGILALLAVSGLLVYNQLLKTDAPSELKATEVATSSTPALGAPGIETSPSPVASAAVTEMPSGSPSGSPVDLTTDANGLSKATVVIETPYGAIKFKFYPKDAPLTVARIAELIQKGFYNELTFHRVVPGFVVQGGDPLGNGTGGSGSKLKAEFNSRSHVEGAVAMARMASDENSADSQFYISLGTHPHLDRQYTVFGQVIEGMEVARKIKVGDKMTKVSIQ